MKEQSYKVLVHLQENRNRKMTAMEVSEETGIAKRLVDSIFSSAIVKNELGYREAADGKNYLLLTSAGINYKQ